MKPSASEQAPTLPADHRATEPDRARAPYNSMDSGLGGLIRRVRRSGKAIASSPRKSPSRTLLGLVSAAVIAVGALRVSAPMVQAATRSCSELGQRPTLRYGDRGSCVTVLQELANHDSGVNLAVDGAFGPKTVAGVRAFQAHHHLVVDGVVGPNTWGVLSNVVGSPEPDTAMSGADTGPIGRPWQCGNTGRGVFLVFADHPSSLTGYKNLVDEAARLHIGIGLAPNGQYVTSGRVDIDYARGAGMCPVDHTYDQTDLRPLSYASIVRELTTSGFATSWGRPPYVALDDTARRAYDDSGLNLCLWNLDPRDWDGKSARPATDYIIRNARPGSTAVIHMNHLETDPAQLRRIQNGLADRGISLCSPYEGTTPLTGALSADRACGSHAIGRTS